MVFFLVKSSMESHMQAVLLFLQEKMGEEICISLMRVHEKNYLQIIFKIMPSLENQTIGHSNAGLKKKRISLEMLLMLSKNMKLMLHTTIKRKKKEKLLALSQEEILLLYNRM